MYQLLRNKKCENIYPSWLVHPKGLRVLDVISWLPEEKISQRELEEIFMDYMNGKNELSEYQVTFILLDDKVVAVIGYKE